jgi:hypothetical protein
MRGGENECMQHCGVKLEGKWRFRNFRYKWKDAIQLFLNE